MDLRQLNDREKMGIMYYKKITNDLLVLNLREIFRYILYKYTLNDDFRIDGFSRWITGGVTVNG